MKKTAEDEFWSTYLEAAREEDEWRPKDWDGNTGSILTFTGLFAATVAAFTVESYKTLAPDPGDESVILLAQLLAVATNGTTTSTSNDHTKTPPFVAPTVDVLANAFWFCSLSVSLVCALLATLIQQWSRDYVRDIRRKQTLNESIRGRAFNHIYVRMGVNRYGMDQMVSWLVALVHLSVALFAAGLFLFLYSINSPVAICATTVLGVFGLAYLTVSAMPIFDRSCPLRTPLTFAFAFIYWLLLRASRYIRSSSLWPRQISLQDVLARQWNSLYYASDDIEFLSHTKRFRYVWECTSRHMFNPVQIAPLMLSTMALFELSTSDKNVQDQLLYLAGDVGLMDQLESCFREVGLASTSESSVAAVQVTTLILQEMLAQEMAGSGDDPNRGSYIDLILMVARADSRTVMNDTRYVLTARLCFCHLRYSLLYLSQRASDPELFALPETDLTHHFSHRSQFPINLAGMHRNMLLLLLNSWQYNGIDASWRDLAHLDWQRDASSSLLPLHDSSCCRLRHGPRSHLAACNALTMISHLLNASEADRAYALNEDLLERFFRLQRGFPLVDWQFYLPMRRKADHRLPPSEEFISVLCRAGLHAWLEPGSNFSTGPPDGPHFQLLTRTFEVGSGFAVRLFSLVEILRSLAHHVDFTKSRRTADTTGPDPNAVTSHLHHDDKHSTDGSGDVSEEPAVTEEVHAAMSDQKDVPLREPDAISSGRT